MLPAQFFTRRKLAGAWTGEQRLMAAVLEDAIDVCCCPGPGHAKGRTLYRQTWNWVNSGDHSWPFSFLRVCEALGLSPSAIRSRLRMRRGGEEGAGAEAPASSRTGSDDARTVPRAAAG